jgi:hypothetical protein
MSWALRSLGWSTSKRLSSAPYSPACSCEETLMDFLKCALEGTEFLCHKGVPDGETPTNVCRGWLSLQMSSSQDPQRSVAQAVFGDFFERLPK